MPRVSSWLVTKAILFDLVCLHSIGSIFCLIWHIYAIQPMSTCSEGYTTRLKLPHWAERSDIYVHFHTTESLGGDDLYDIPAIL